MGLLAAVSATAARHTRMSDQNTSIGVCPNCERSVTTASLLIEYERDDGTTGQFADCPHCDSVVKPV